MASAKSVTVQTGCRLHFGMLTHKPEQGREFGGVGMMLTEPGVRLTARALDRSVADADLIRLADAVPDPLEVEQFLRRGIDLYRKCSSGEQQSPRLELTVDRLIPRHQGLGSGTQLALAIGVAVSTMESRDESASPLMISRQMERGRRSAIGLHGFSRGGLIVEAGKREPEEISPAIFSHPVPDEWRVVLVLPTTELGLHGSDEREAFRRLPPMPADLTGRLCQITMTDLLPAVMQREFDEFSEAVYQFGRLVGEYFASEQGDVFADPQMGRLAEELRRDGIRGVGQSSWGPSLFALLPNQPQADQLAQRLRQQGYEDCRILVASPLNSRARVDVLT